MGILSSHGPRKEEYWSRRRGALRRKGITIHCLLYFLTSFHYLKINSLYPKENRIKKIKRNKVSLNTKYEVWNKCRFFPYTLSKLSVYLISGYFYANSFLKPCIKFTRMNISWNPSESFNLPDLKDGQTNANAFFTTMTFSRT